MRTLSFVCLWAGICGEKRVYRWFKKVFCTTHTCTVYRYYLIDSNMSNAKMLFNIVCHATDAPSVPSLDATPEKCHEFLNFFNPKNSSLSSGKEPYYLKSALIQPHLKKPRLNSHDFNIFRSIFKLFSLAKVLEKIVANQILEFMKQNLMFESFKSGFNAHHSTKTE